MNLNSNKEIKLVSAFMLLLNVCFSNFFAVSRKYMYVSITNDIGVYTSLKALSDATRSDLTQTLFDTWTKKTKNIERLLN